MKKKARTGERLAVALASCFSVGVLLGWSLRGKPPSPASLSSPSSTSPVVSVLRQAQGVLPSLSRDGFSSTTPKDDGPAATTGEPLISAPPLAPVGAAIDELQHRDLDVPI